MRRLLVLFCVFSVGLPFLGLSGGCSVITREAGEPLPRCEPATGLAPRDVDETLERLGPPHGMSTLDDRTVFLYEYVFSKEKQLGLSSSVDWLEWFKFSLGNADARHQARLMLFDEGGTLLAQQCLDQDNALGNAMGVQFLITVSSLVDATHLYDAVNPNDWGAALLQPLPRQLNRPSSLDGGEQGVELLGTPSHVGQHTLEMR